MTSGSRDSERQERCASCGHSGEWHDEHGTCRLFQPYTSPAEDCYCDGWTTAPPAAPPPAEGETHAARVYAENLAKMPGRTPPVVGDQPEETDTVNDESDNGRPSIGSRAYRAAINPGSVGTDEEMASMQAFALMALCDAAPTWAEAVGETPHALVVTVSDAAVIAAKLAIAYRATSPAVGAEVRVEWGVRYELFSGGTWRNDYIKACDSREQAKWARDYTIPQHPKAWRNPELMRRTITTYADGSFLTSAWQPETDDRQEAERA